MWITKDVNLPEELIDALQNDKLVIFAGAGISKAPPSNLPNFNELSELIVRDLYKPKDNEPPDVFLGRMVDKKIPVHSRTIEILRDEKSKPNSMHNDLIKLYGSAKNVRLVTTNQDRHFSELSKTIFSDESVELYYAPALPLGNDFKGIVYLHGHVDKEERFLILTDKDFGEAYLTEGWAARFLKNLFLNYIVLFIGYSHNDPLLRYLARGLSPGSKKRYVLTKHREESNEGDWEFLGITPILYPKSEGDDEHVALYDSISAWEKYTNMGYLDRERKIREIALKGPPIEIEDNDFIKNALNVLEFTRFFTRFAQGLDWLKWVEDNGGFRNIFQAGRPITDIDIEVVHWYNERFIIEFPDEALGVIMRNGNSINPSIWQIVANYIAFIDPLPDTVTLGKWVELLIDTYHRGQYTETFDYLLQRCSLPEYKYPALILFENRTKPVLVLEPSFKYIFENIKRGIEPSDFDLTIEGNANFLTKNWNKNFQPNLQEIYKDLKLIISCNLIRLANLQKAIQGSDTYPDLICFDRHAIEKHEQDQYSRKFGVLVDSARDLLEWMLNEQIEEANTTILEWYNSDVPILVRLAIHGIIENQNISPDDKINWVIEKDIVFSIWYKHEVFRLLKVAYPNALSETRNRLIERINKGIIKEDAKRLSRKTLEYEIYNILVWLNISDPSCKIVEKSLNNIKQKNPNFKPREYPDLNTAITSVDRQHPGPISVEELLEKEPVDNLEWFQSHKSEGINDDSPGAIWGVISEAIIRDFDWGWKLISIMEANSIWEPSYWKTIIWSWSRCTLSDVQWQNVLNFIKEHDTLYNLDRHIIELIEEGIDKAEGRLPLTCISQTENIIDHLYRICTNKEFEVHEVMDRDWLDFAINHIGGRMGLIWIHTISRRITEGKEEPNSVIQQYEQRFEKAINGDSQLDQMIRIIACSQLHFIFNLDKTWAVNNLLPLFNWENNSFQASQAWHGYIGWGRWNEALLPKLLKFYKQTFLKLSSLPDRMRDAFCDDMASIAIYSSINPIKDGWLNDFISQDLPECLTKFAGGIHRHLGGLTAEGKTKIWNRWINEYWSNRRDGIPIPLTNEELKIMVSWAIPLLPIFPEIVEKICQTVNFDLYQTDLYYDLEKHKFAIQFPEATANLLLHLLKLARDRFLHCNYVQEIIRQLISTLDDSSKLKELCDHLSRLGCPQALELSDLIDNR